MMDLTLEQWRMLKSLTQHEGWPILGNLMYAVGEKAESMIYGNSDPEKQLLLHQGIGAVNVIRDIGNFIASSDAQIARLEAEAAQSAPSDADPMVFNEI